MTGNSSTRVGSGRNKKIRWALLCAALSLFAPVSAQSLKSDLSTQTDLHAKLKTAYLFNTAKFVTWEEEQTTVRLCLRGKSATPQLAAKLDGKDLGDGRNLQVQQGIHNNASCHIVFDDGSTALKEREILFEQIDPKNVLLISDGNGALEMGYTMQFFVQNDSVRFALHGERLKKANFKVSSKLQRLARTPGET